MWALREVFGNPFATRRRHKGAPRRGWMFGAPWRTDTVLALARTALQRAGFEPREVLVGGGADANVFNERGLHCVNMANGMTNVHTAEEEIAVADLEAMVAVTLELVEAARGSA